MSTKRAAGGQWQMFIALAKHAGADAELVRGLENSTVAFREISGATWHAPDACPAALLFAGEMAASIERDGRCLRRWRGKLLAELTAAERLELERTIVTQRRDWFAAMTRDAPAPAARAASLNTLEAIDTRTHAPVKLNPDKYREALRLSRAAYGRT